MKTFLLTLGIVSVLALPSPAQVLDPVPAPADVALQFATESGQSQFHLGELIPVKFSYTAANPGRYIWVSQSGKLAGGHPVEVSCSPSAERASSLPPSQEFEKFAAMLNSPCGGGGFGGGIGSGCGDCDWEQGLGAGAISFGPVPLNTYVRFRAPGTYTCVASSADVTTTLRDEKVRAALLIKSNPIVLGVVADPSWSNKANRSYSDAYENLCRSDDVPTNHFLECPELAQRITYLDTADSLATEVRLFDGRNHGWDNGFWGAIQSTSYPSEALRLMTTRIQDPDVEVSTTILESLAVWDLRIESPEAFSTTTVATYHARALDKLRKYVRLLGDSLASKTAKARPESIKTYRALAEQEYCGRQPLILKRERNQILTASGVGP